MATMYGINNCDTIKKAKKWLEANEIEYTFNDYKKLGADEKILNKAIETFGIDTVLNKRGTTYKQLPEDVKANIDSDNVIDLLMQHTSMIKRPILEHESQLIVGFKPEQYAEFFSLN